MDGAKLDDLSIPELIELLHRIADEIMLREMQNAGEDENYSQDDCN